MSEHTPGPWKQDVADWWITDADDVVIAAMATDDLHPIVSLEANARLIAAAPDLLEACKRLDQFQRDYQDAAIDDMPGNEHYASKLMSIFIQSRAAIAKATNTEQAPE